MKSTSNLALKASKSMFPWGFPARQTPISIFYVRNVANTSPLLAFSEVERSIQRQVSTTRAHKDSVLASLKQPLLGRSVPHTQISTREIE